LEKELYSELGLKTTWVGHPLLDELASFQADPEVIAELAPIRGQKIAIAPGSRPSELKRHLPVLQQLVNESKADTHFLLPLAPALNPGHLGDLGQHSRVHVLRGHMRSVIKTADAAVVASGTATLETGLLGTPMVVGYRMKRLSYMLARRLVQIEHIALVNIVLGRGVVPELIQNEFNPRNIGNHLKAMIHGDEGIRMKKAFEELPDRLGGMGAGRRAAEVVGEYL
jgi:lipid-A-disaccharide synthase